MAKYKSKEQDPLFAQQNPELKQVQYGNTGVGGLSVEDKVARLEASDKQFGKRKQAGLDLQELQNKGTAYVSDNSAYASVTGTILNNQGAGERTAAQLKAEAPVRAAQVRAANAGATSQEFTNTLANQGGYAKKRLDNELALQGMATEKIGMESDLLKQDFDKIQADAGMKRATEYQQQPEILAGNRLADWKAEKAAQKVMAPSLVTSSRGAVNNYSAEILGEPGILSSVAEKVPFLGVLERGRRLSAAKEKARKGSL